MIGFSNDASSTAAGFAIGNSEGGQRDREGKLRFFHVAGRGWQRRGRCCRRVRTAIFLGGGGVGRARCAGDDHVSRSPASCKDRSDAVFKIALAAGLIAGDGSKAGIGAGTALFGMVARFEHEEAPSRNR